MFSPFDGNGNGFIADAASKRAFVPPHGKLDYIAQNTRPDCCVVGRTPADTGSLYMATIRGDVNVEAGNVTTRGSISNIDVRAGAH